MRSTFFLSALLLMSLQARAATTPDSCVGELCSVLSGLGEKVRPIEKAPQTSQVVSICDETPPVVPGQTFGHRSSKEARELECKSFDAETTSYIQSVRAKIKSFGSDAVKLIVAMANAIRASALVSNETWQFGFSLGISGNLAGPGLMYGVEMVRFEKGKMAFFCAPGQSAAVGSATVATTLANIPLAAGWMPKPRVTKYAPTLGDSQFTVLGYSFIVPMGCNVAEDYTGNFMTVAGSFPLPIVSAASYSWGANMHQFLLNLEERSEDGRFNAERLRDEIGILKDWVFGSESARLVVCSVLGWNEWLSGELGDLCTSAPAVSKNGAATAEEAVKQTQGAAQRAQMVQAEANDALKKLLSSEVLRQQAPNIMAIFDSFAGTFSGCNSVTVGGGIGKSASKISASASLTHYTLAFEMDEYDARLLLSLARMLSLSREGYLDFIELNRQKTMAHNMRRLSEILDGMVTLAHCPTSVNTLYTDDWRLYRQLFPPPPPPYVKPDPNEK